MIKLNLFVVGETERKPFLTYYTYTKNNKKLNVKFQRSCKDIPEKDCTIFVKEENFNIDENNRFRAAWIKGIEEVKPLEVKKRDYSELFDVVEND